MTNKGINSLGVNSGRLILTLFLFLIAVLTLMPFYWMLIMSTHSTIDIFSKPSLLPGNHIAQNFKSILDVNFFGAFLNSIYTAVSSMMLTIFFSSMAGFALSKYNFRFKNVLFVFIIATMLVPQEVGLVAYVWEMRMLGLSKTLLPLILPHIANAFGVFWMKQYMEESVPYEIMESGWVDGCNDFRIFVQLVLPIVKPALFTLAVIAFMASWNSYMLPLVIINKPSLYTIPIAIGLVGTWYLPDYGARILGVVLGIAPLLLIFIFASKVITRGLTAGAVKG